MNGRYCYLVLRDKGTSFIPPVSPSDSLVFSGLAQSLLLSGLLLMRSLN